jgi:adenosylcobinamide-GDP ribazoletransferase
MREIIGDVLICLGFFTRLPVTGAPDRRLASAIWAAPLVGIFVALAGALAFTVVDALGLPPGIAAAFALAAMMLFTGCLHEDGLADVADGFGGGSTRERKLEIMKDSRIGTYGVVAMVVAMLLKWSALQELATQWLVFTALIAAYVSARALMPAFMLMVPPARSFGLSAGAGAVSPGAAAVALFIGAAALLFLGLFPAIVAAIVLGLWFIALKTLTERQIGGQTGDVLGTLEQGGEIAVLLVALSFHS